MSNDTAPVIPLETENTEEAVEKQSLFQRRVVTPFKKHPKLAIAIAGGLALVGGAAYVGRATAPSNDSTEIDVYEPEIEDFVETDLA